ncbi:MULTISPECIES: TonB-dependent receptor [Pseudoalteromonas]|uniref:TonB-dependent receptor n=1 Tax=Pseudoalteromonas amylolytica TaxID=1859457 RepID=A0A1S1MVE2_9GAMM|nr:MULTISPECIES: TonB-dependent receptor [Pseudoalteromonas]OHU87427.1 TonB-dependent receptor [Pseudoalteromonas sp. JW3]OHU90868.1 TonB-dependent receptor [Pseudoalteromonas amylolytica]
MSTTVRNLNPVAGALALAFASLASTSVMAQEQEAQAEKSKMEAITVTATKRSQVIYEVPIAMSAFSGDDLDSQGISDITDVGKFVPNLNITGFSAGHNSSANPFIRGIGLQDHLITTDPGVSVYVDGVYLGRQVGQNWNLANIERIEVLRGPQGTLYGRNSIGGAINIITKAPDQAAVTKVSAEVGTRGRLKGSIFTNQAVSEDLAFNFNMGFNRRGGIGEFVNLPNAEYDVGENQEFHGRVSVKYNASEDLRLVFTADANDGEGGTRPYTTLIDELPNGRLYQNGLRNEQTTADPYDNATSTYETSTVSNKANGVSLTAEYDINADFGTKFIFSKRSSEYKAGLDDDSTAVALDHYPERGTADQTSVELQLTGYLGRADFVTGVYWFNEEGSNRQDSSEASFDGGPTKLELDQETTSRAVFVNVGYDATDDLRISGGVRYTEDEKSASTNVFDPVGTIYSSREWDEISWELAANYTFENGLNWYGTVQTGYQSGQFPARPYFLIGQFFGAGGFDNPEAAAIVRANNAFMASDNISAINYETGFKGQLTDDFSMSVAFFNTEYDDLPYQVNVVTDAGFDTNNLIVEQTSRGVEFESTYYVTDSFTLHSSFGFMDVDVQEQNGVKPVAPLTPEWTASISPSYEFGLSNGATVTTRLDVSYRDDMYGEPSSDPRRMTQIDARTTTNFDISYAPANANWDISLYGRNIFDERYDDARLNTGDYILVIKSNDASEFGVRYKATF